MKKLLLVNPYNNPNLKKHWVESYFPPAFEPLALGIIAALTPIDWEIKIVDEQIEPFQYIPCDLVGITASTANINRAYEIAEIIKQYKIPTVLGGVHGTILPDEALRYFDTVVTGEAEDIWPQVTDDFNNGKLKRIYNGKRLDVLNVPKARRDLFSDKYRYGLIQTSRGCPFNCEFCYSSKYNGHIIRRRPVEEVLDEIETIKQKKIFFVDDNLFGYSNNDFEYTSNLLEGIIKRGINKYWVCQTSINISSNSKLLKLAYKSGCRLLLIGFEAENKEALNNINKPLNYNTIRKTNMRPYKQEIRNIHLAGICIIGAFIYGIDSDNIESLKNREQFMLKSKLDNIQLTLLVPNPGTNLYTRLKNENRMLTKNYPQDWNNFVIRKAVFKPKNISPELLELQINRSRYKINKLHRILFRVFRSWYETGSYSAAYISLYHSIGMKTVFRNKLIKFAVIFLKRKKFTL